jgi:hypothetical protein
MLADLIKAIQVGTLGPSPVPSAIAALVEEAPQPQRVGEGAALATKLEASISGRKGKAAQTFEVLCQQALELLYGENFAGWKKQPAIEKGYQRLAGCGKTFSFG